MFRNKSDTKKKMKTHMKQTNKQTRMENENFF